MLDRDPRRATVDAVARIVQTPNFPERNLRMLFYHPPQTEKSSVLVAFDLRETESWKSAHDLRAGWGAGRSIVHILDPDHVVLELLAGCSSGSDAKESA